MPSRRSVRRGIRDLGLAPRLDLPLHRLKVALDAVHSDRKRIDQVEAVGVLGQNGREHAWHNVAKFWIPRIVIYENRTSGPE